MLIGFIPLILAAVIRYSSYDTSEIINILLLGVLLLLNIFIQREAYGGIRTTYADNYSRQTCEKILDVAKEQEAELIVMYDASEWSEMIRVYDSNYPTVTYHSINDNIWDFDYINETDASDLQERNSILVVPAGRQNELLDQMSEQYKYVYWEDIDGMSVYKKTF